MFLKHHGMIVGTLPGRVAVLFVLWLMLGVSLGAQEEEAPSTPPITTEMVEGDIAAAEANANLTEEQKSELLGILQQNLEISGAAQEWAAQAAQFREQTAEAPALLAELQETLEAPPTPIDLEADIPEEVTLGYFEDLVTRLETQLSEAVALRNELEAEPTRRANRRQQLPEQLSAARKRLEALPASAPEVGAETPAPIAQARQQQYALRRQAIMNEIAALEAEMASYEARSQVLVLRTDLAIRNVDRLESALKRAREMLSEQRQIFAERAAEEARKLQLEAGGADPLVRERVEAIAARNAELVEQRTGADGLLQKIEDVGEEEQRLNREKIRIEGDQLNLREKIETIGLNNATGLLLRNQQNYLPNLRKLRRDQRELKDRITEVQVEQIQFREMRMELSNIDNAVSEILDEVAPNVEETERENLRALLRDMLQSQRNNLDALLESYADYINQLIQLDTRTKELITLVEEFSTYINERVLWIRSGAPLSLDNFIDSWDALQWFGNPEHWRNVGYSWYMDLFSYPYLYGFLGLLIAVWLAMRKKLRRAIDEEGKKAVKVRCTDYGPTLRTFIETLIISSPLPLLCAFLAWRCTVMSYGGDFVRSLAPGFIALTFLMLTFNTFRHVLRPNGLGISHFGWSEQPALQVRRIMRWFLFFTTPFVFVIAVMEYTNNETWKESLGRSSLMVMMLLLAGLAWRALHPTRGPVQQLLEHRLLEGQTRVRKLWFVLGVGVPVGLAIAAGMGYYYSAWSITYEIYLGATVLLGFMLVYGMSMRWSLMAHRSLRIEQAKKRLAAMKAKAQEEVVEKDESMSEVVEVEEEEIDLQKVDEQTQRLIKGLMGISLVVVAWFIWSDQLNAINILDRVPLWPSTEVVTETITTPDGEEVQTVTDVAQNVTLAHLFMAFLIGFFTFLATRNLPGLLEISVLQRLQVASGERYAIVTIARYIITAIGVVMVFNALNIGWSNVQWLVAALSVGLGFGLQEIFANFVSGIILLFERPIRVGDVVTIGGTSGTVSKIRIRATTITDFDRKELVVPNREFVTGQLINWTLSDATLRVIVPVGIAYGSDTEKAITLLRQAADEHPLVMQDPGPNVYFMSFGDSTLNFELRCFSPSIDHLLKIIHDLHMDVDRLFRENGIEIAFPQQDIHVRSIEDYLKVVAKDKGPSVKIEDSGNATAE